MMLTISVVLSVLFEILLLLKNLIGFRGLYSSSAMSTPMPFTSLTLEMVGLLGWLPLPLP